MDVCFHAQRKNIDSGLLGIVGYAPQKCQLPIVAHIPSLFTSKSKCNKPQSQLYFVARNVHTASGKKEKDCHHIHFQLTTLGHGLAQNNRSQ